MDRKAMMKNVAEIISRGSVDKNLPAWANMRHAWRTNDNIRDAGLEYPEDVIQIKNLDYKKPLDPDRLNLLLMQAQRENIQSGSAPYKNQIIMYADSGDAADVDSPVYPDNSLMDLCVPLDYVYGEQDTGKLYPVIINVHGGGWFYGDKELYSHYCCHLAGCGAVVVNFNYRLAPQNKYPAAVQDVACVVRYIHENAKALGLDMQRFYMTGDSAGAQLVANYCIIASNRDYRYELDFFTYDRLPQRICLNCGAYDMAQRNGNISDWYMKNEDGSYAMSDVQKELFLNQLNYMTKDFPQTYLMYSVNDDLAFHTEMLDRRMTEIGIDHITKAYGRNNPDSGHIFHVNLRNIEGQQCNAEECAFLLGSHGAGATGTGSLAPKI